MWTYKKHMDAVPESRLWKVSERSNMNHYCMTALKELYKRSKSRINRNKILTDTFIVNERLRQYRESRPYLFTLRRRSGHSDQWQRGLTIKNKTKYLLLGIQRCHLEEDKGQVVLPSQESEYLGIIFDNTRSDVKEIEKPIVEAKKVKRCLNGILWSKEIREKRNFNSSETRLQSSLSYGAEI